MNSYRVYWKDNLGNNHMHGINAMNPKHAKSIFKNYLQYDVKIEKIVELTKTYEIEVLWDQILSVEQIAEIWSMVEKADKSTLQPVFFYLYGVPEESINISTGHTCKVNKNYILMYHYYLNKEICEKICEYTSLRYKVLI